MNTYIASDLEIARENTRFRLQAALDSVKKEDALEASGVSYMNAAVNYRKLAICELLIAADHERFFSFLYKSGQVRLFFLQAVDQGRDVPPNYLCASRNGSYVDALGAEAFDLAVAIAEITPKKHQPQIEYEEDFLRAHFLHGLCLNIHAGHNVDLQAIIDRWHTLPTEEDHYYHVCKALLDRNADAFHQSFSELISRRLARVNASRKDFAVDPEIPLVYGPVYLMGLALLRLSELLGMSVDTQFESIPNMARNTGITVPLPNNAWREIDHGLRS